MDSFQGASDSITVLTTKREAVFTLNFMLRGLDHSGSLNAMKTYFLTLSSSI